MAYLPALCFSRMWVETQVFFSLNSEMQSQIADKNLTFPLVEEEAEKINQATLFCNVDKQNIDTN